MTRLTSFSIVLASLAVIGIAGPAAGHHPDPTFSGALFAQNQTVEYRWRSGQVPPTWMKDAIQQAAADSNASRQSRAAVFVYDSAGASAIAYDEPTPCGALGAACANRSAAPDSFNIWFRRHGYLFDWGALRWCQAYTTAPNGCYDAEAIALHEFGHAQILAHHDVYPDESDYRTSVMNRIARAKPESHYDMHRYAPCDVATLQRRYDVPSYATKIATCQSLATTLALSASDASPAYRDSVTFTATLRIRDDDAYGKLGYNPLTARTVTIQRRLPGATTWQSVASMAAANSGNGYTFTQTQSTTYDWRAVFSDPDDEGVNGSTSATIRVTVAPCIGSLCPQLTGD